MFIATGKSKIIDKELQDHRGGGVAVSYQDAPPPPTPKYYQPHRSSGASSQVPGLWTGSQRHPDRHRSEVSWVGGQAGGQ